MDKYVIDPLVFKVTLGEQVQYNDGNVRST